MLGMLFLSITGFSIYRSKKRLETALCALVVMILTAGLLLGFVRVVPALNNEAAGGATFDIMLLVGALAALIHSRKVGDH